MQMDRITAATILRLGKHPIFARPLESVNIDHPLIRQLAAKMPAGKL